MIIAILTQSVRDVYWKQTNLIKSDNNGLELRKNYRNDDNWQTDGQRKKILLLM